MAGLSSIQQAILDLVSAFCYDGVEQSKIAYVDSKDARLPRLETNEFDGYRFRCEGRVPEAFIRACIINVKPDRQQELWGVSKPDVDSELRYLCDRELLDKACKKYRPHCGGFYCPFDGSEIVSTIELDEKNVNASYRVNWLVKAAMGTVTSVVVHEGQTAIEQTLYGLTEKGHEFRNPLSSEPRIFMGDHIHDNPKATIVSRSTVQDSFNRERRKSTVVGALFQWITKKLVSFFVNAVSSAARIASGACARASSFAPDEG